MTVKLSIIVTTYNWPYALRLVLNSLINQKTDCPFEIIIADDGSKEETAELIRFFKERTSIPLLHIWQSDNGFRVSTIRNKAIIAANGDYIVFLDGDCIPRQDFVKRHMNLAEHGCFVVGNRVLLNQTFTLTALSEVIPLHQWNFWQWSFARLKGYCNRLLPFLTLFPFSVRSSKRWKGAKGCNLGVWRYDLFKINGWEEKFSGWGYEDSDLVIRLLRIGLKRKSGRFQVPVIHLWHPENDRSRAQENKSMLKSRQTDLLMSAELGLNQYK